MAGKKLDSNDVDGQRREEDFSVTAIQSQYGQGHEVDPQPAMVDLEMEAFMNQEMVIRVLETADDERNAVQVYVNGTPFMFPKGVQCKARRMAIEALARCKQTKFTQRRMDLTNPEASNTLTPRTALAFPFEVIHDPNPRGREWLQRIMAETA